MRFTHVDQVYATAAFRLLAQSMKNKHAFNIVFLLGQGNMEEFKHFEEWASSELERQENS